MRILDATVHPLAAGWTIDMPSIAGQENSPLVEMRTRPAMNMKNARPETLK
jgi:hypothetical protein